MTCVDFGNGVKVFALHTIFTTTCCFVVKLALHELISVLSWMNVSSLLIVVGEPGSKKTLLASFPFLFPFLLLSSLDAHHFPH